MSHVFVLGSNSFGGASFIDYMLHQGFHVTGISRSVEPHPIMLPYKSNPHLENFTFFQLDINDDFEAIVDLVNKIQPEYIADFAGQGMVAPSWQWPEQWYHTNITSKVKLHNVFKDLKCLKKYIRISTPEVFGNCEDLIDESAPYNPSTPYAVSHAAIDMSLAAFHKQYDFPVVFTRFANFYGAGQQLYRIVPRTLICALSDETLMLQGGGKSVRAFIHGHDVASGIFAAMQLGKNGESYHFTTDEFVQISELVDRIAKTLNVPLESFVKIAPDRPGKDQAYLMNPAKAKADLKWEPKYNLEKGIAQSASWVKENLDTILSLPQNYIHKA